MNVNIFRGKCSFVAAFSDNNQVLNHFSSSYLQVGFIGRSNVGKSSTINALLGRKNFVRSSKTPGRTQNLNFFNLEDKFMLVDMPGYGYANISKVEKTRISNLIADYLQTSANLKRVFLIIDARFGVKENDSQMMDMLDILGVSYQVVLNKCDKVAKSKLQEIVNSVKKETIKRPACYNNIIVYSTYKKVAIDEFKAEIIKALNI